MARSAGPEEGARVIPGTSRNQESRRHAALALHAVSHADRLWLLDQLPRSAREELEPLLRELSALGIPSDPSFISRVVRPGETPDSTERLLRPENAARIAEIVSGEPQRVAACLASLGDSQWRAAFASQLAKGARAALTNASGEASVTCPPRLAEAVLRQVALRLNAQMSTPATPRRNWKSRILGALGSRAT
jgi:hypothetical protein